MATLRLFNYIYGNYNDQRVADTTDLAGEFDASLAVFEQEDVNVSYNDGLMITLVVNIEDNLIESVNYATITDGDVIRPFYVLSYAYLRKGQYEIALKLDTVLYKLNFIKNARGNVFRGFVDNDNPVIYNNEGIEVTQVKTAEYPLYPLINNRKADIGWYAVYADRKLGTSPDDTGKMQFKLSNNAIIADETYGWLDNYPFSKYVNNPTLFHSISESHVLQNVTSGPYKNDYDSSVQCYKLSSSGVSQYNGYEVILSRAVFVMMWDAYAKFFLDGWMKQPVEYYDTGRYYSFIGRSGGDMWGEGIYRNNPSDPIYDIKNSNLIGKYHLKKADLESRQSWKTLTIPAADQKTRSQIESENGKVLKIGTRYYRVSVKTVRHPDTLVRGNSNDYIQTFLKNKIFSGSSVEPVEDVLLDELNQEIADFTELYSESHQRDPGIVNHLIMSHEVSLTLEEIDDIGSGVFLGTYGGGGTSLKPGPSEEPYKLILLPYGKLRVINHESDKEIVVTESIVKNIVSNLIHDYPGAIYDVQKIPYAPIKLTSYFIVYPDGYTQVIGDSDRGEMYILSEGDQPYAVFFNAEKTTGTLNINSNIPYKGSGDRKLDTVTLKSNIISPSHKTVAEYEYVKNNYGSRFVVTIDLKPYTPYFNIDFVADDQGVFFSDYNDGRGINIAEDFSLTMFTDEFEAYKRNNSTYLQAFNSQLDYQQAMLDLQQRNELTRNEIDKEQAWVNYGISAAGAVVNTAVGVGVGVATGGIGLAVGGVSAAKSGTGLITGAAQTHLDNKFRDRKIVLQQGFAKDQLALQQAQAKEQFQMGLQNIQNRPARLDKVSGVTALQRKVPYIALYDTAQSEKERLKQYFQFNGYNINKIDMLGNYIDTNRPMSYLKATIIESNESVNNTILQDINQRLSVGVYFMKGV